MDPSYQAVSSLQLALAALFGASVVAVSAFYAHKRTVDQVLDRLITLRRRSPVPANDRLLVSEDDDNSDGVIEVDGDKSGRDSARSWEESLLGKYRVSSSFPNVELSNEWVDDDGNCDEPMRFGHQGLSSSWDKLNLIPSGLPPLDVSQRDGHDQSINASVSKMRIGSGGRLMTPRTPCGYAFESIGDSDEETELASGEDIDFSYENINCSAENVELKDNDSNCQKLSAPPFKCDNRTCIGDQIFQSVKNTARENLDQYCDGNLHLGSMHIMGSDRNFANTVFPLTTTVHGSMSKEEEEVWKMIRECLDLRERYVYREEVAPWMKETAGESCISGKDSDPLCIVPVEATAHYFRMEDGVVHVYASEIDTTELFPVVTSAEFFTDMHHLLKVISIGNVHSTCHHRLRFLEEKFRLHLLVNADLEFLAQKSASHRDFYNIRKVDTHVHHSACMNQKHLLRFIKSKLRQEPDEVVIFRDGIYYTLKEVFESLQLTGYDLNVDLLDVHAQEVHKRP